MRRMSDHWGRVVLLVFMLVVGVATALVRAQERTEDEPTRAWTNDTELSWVVASGNSQANTLGFRNVYEYRWRRANLRWETGWVRATSRDGERFAVRQVGGGLAVVDPPTTIDSQRLYSKLGYRRQIGGPHYWFSNFDSTRDEPSNIGRQLIGAGGFGTQWADRDGFRFRSEYGISVTSEDLVLEGDKQFGGYRLSYALDAAVTSHTTVDSELTFDGSFRQADDIRTDWLNGVSVSITSRVALRSSVRLLFRRLPALEEVDLATGGLDVVSGTVEIPKRKLDTNFTTSLVITF